MIAQGDVLLLKVDTLFSACDDVLANRWLRKGELCVIVSCPEWTGWSKVFFVVFTSSSCVRFELSLWRDDLDRRFERVGGP